MSELSTAIAELNRRRLRALGPLMICLHAAHVVFFHVPAALRSTFTPETLRWRDSLVEAHALTIPFILTLTWIVYRVRDPFVIRLAGPLTALVYLLHGAIVGSLDQVVSNNVSAYIGYCIGIAVVVWLTPRVGIFVYAVSCATMIGGLMVFQRSAAARLSSFPTCATVAVVSVAVSWMLDKSRRRELAQRATIDRQRDELSTLNASLNERVREQVAEIVARAGEVERLNAQLHEKVRARSVELSLALARLAGKRDSDETLAHGLVLADRFTIELPIGKGGMGTVYSGLDRSTGRRVAIKVIQASSSHQLDAMRRFIAEAGTAATLSHSAIVRMLHVDVTDDGLLFQAQELVDGETLSKHVHRVWPPPEVARFGGLLATALAAAHALGVVHRDVKPDNLMLTVTPPGLKLLDFGIAKLYDAVARGDGEMTGARMVVGTPGYMAPEQANGSDGVGDRADIYALGVILHQLATARLPDPTAPMETPAALAAVINRCLADHPRDRPSAAALAEELTRFADVAGAPLFETLARAALAEGPTAAPPEAAVPTTPHRRGSA